MERSAEEEGQRERQNEGGVPFREQPAHHKGSELDLGAN